jgi:hypothetical protein
MHHSSTPEHVGALISCSIGGFVLASLTPVAAMAAPPETEGWSSEEIRLEEVQASQEVQLSQSQELSPEEEQLDSRGDDGWSGTLEIYGYLPTTTNTYTKIGGTEA